MSLCIWVTIQTLFLDPHFQKLESVSLGWNGIFIYLMADSVVQSDLLAPEPCSVLWDAVSINCRVNDIPM